MFRYMCEAERVVVGINRDEVFQSLIDEYEKLILSLCYRMVGDYFYAEDLAQDTFIAAYNSLDKFDGVNAKGWLCKIATRKCLDHLKSFAMKATPEEEDKLNFEAGQTKTLEDEFFKSELSEQIRQSCEDLSEPYRSVATEYYLHDKPLSVIAKETGTPLKTVQTRAYRAKQMLKLKLKEAVKIE